MHCHVTIASLGGIPPGATCPGAQHRRPCGSAPCRALVSDVMMRGARPAIPPHELLPSAEARPFAGVDAYMQLMRCCWAQQPEERPTFEEVIQVLR